MLENIRNFFLTFVWLPLNFFPFGRSRGLILSARLVLSLVLRWDIIASGVAKNRSHRKKWGDWVTCLSLAILALGPLFNYLQ